MPNPCREHWVDDLVCCLKGIDVWVYPRRLRIGDLFDGKADEFVPEVLANVRWEILDSRINLRRPLRDPWEGEDREWGLLELVVAVNRWGTRQEYENVRLTGLESRQRSSILNSLKMATRYHGLGIGNQLMRISGREYWCMATLVSFASHRQVLWHQSAPSTMTQTGQSPVTAST